MLKKEERLTVSDIEALSQGKSVFGTFFSVRFLPTAKTKFAVAVSKKVAPLAVDRNRVRRQTYSALAEIKNNLTIPVYAMVIPKKEFFKASFPDIVKELCVVFRKAGLLSADNK